MGLSISYAWHRFTRACRKDTQLCHEGKNTDGVWRNPCPGFLMFSLSHEKSLMECTFTPGMKMQQHMCNVYPGKSIRHSASKVLPGTWSRTYLLSSTYQDSRLPEGKQEVGISHTVCTNILGTVTYSRLLTGDWGCSDSQVSRCQSPTTQASLSKDSSL